MKYWCSDIIGYWVIEVGCYIEKELEISPSPPNFSEDFSKLLPFFISIAFFLYNFEVSMSLNSCVNIFGCLYIQTTTQFCLSLLMNALHILRSFCSLNLKKWKRSVPPFSESIGVRLWNTGLVSSGASLTSWQEGASLALAGKPSSDGVMIKIPYGVDVWHRPVSQPIFSYWVG